MCKPFHVDVFKENLMSEWMGKDFIYKKEVDSTNLILKSVPSEKLNQGTTLLADYQAKGRGQYEKKWNSDPFRDLTFTIALKPKSGTRYTLLTLGCAKALADVLQKYTDETIRIKWPNDLMVRDKKIGGILTESIFMGNKPDRVLIGIGLNIYQKKFHASLSNIAVSLQQIAHKPITREILLCECLKEIEEVYHQWVMSDPNLLVDIHKILIGYGEWVKLSIYNNIQPDKYKFIGISNKGELLMLNEQLDVNKFSYEQVRIIPCKQPVPEA